MHTPSVIIVTGASQGIGAAVARCLSQKDTALTLVARSATRLQQVADDIQKQHRPCLTFPADVADPSACRDVVAASIDAFGSLSGLVNNAGILEPMLPLGRSKPADWRYNIEVNLLGPVYMTIAALPELRKQGGRIVNVSSGAAHHAIAAASAYCAAKAALNQFNRVLATEEPQIAAVAVRPGVVDTAMQATLRRHGPKVMPPTQAAYYQNLKRNRQLVPPQEPARSIAWLVLNATRSLSGEFIDYDDPRIQNLAEAAFS